MNKHALVTLGKKTFEEKDYEAAERILINAIDKGAKYPDVYYTLGLTCHSLGEINRAIHYFREALKLNAEYVEALLGLSITLNDTGKYREAKEAFNKAIDAVSGKKTVISDTIVKPRMANLHRELGRVSMSINRYEDAVFYFKKALEIAPEYIDVKLEYAGALREKGDFAEAKEVLEEILKEKPAFVPALLGIGIINYVEGDVAEARAFWEKSLTIEPTNRLAHLYLKSIPKGRD
ncbi:MAG: tetratricopeptide repeat protein [Deltaproteobacteria bacterium]|nr:tetratricopeptide repeat protein [Deltaproteobacteria bacterium]NIS77504.1 tetratricopeptide repeat protein [Deltaproteobacteria bacterium]